MIYVDSCIPMYLVGAEHPNKQRVIEVVSRLVESGETLVTSSDTFLEIIHRYKDLKNTKHLNAAYEALEEMVSMTADVTKKDADTARNLSLRHPGLSSRDCLHAAVMKRIHCDKIWTFDEDFDGVPSIQRIA